MAKLYLGHVKMNYKVIIDGTWKDLPLPSASNGLVTTPETIKGELEVLQFDEGFEFLQEFDLSSAKFCQVASYTHCGRCH
jgi:hypothetical protein